MMSAAATRLGSLLSLSFSPSDVVRPADTYYLHPRVRLLLRSGFRAPTVHVET